MAITANTFNINGINFCLDNNFIEIIKQNKLASKVRMDIVMRFKEYSKEIETIKQTYEYVFFQNKVTLYPGEDVEDFFSDISKDIFALENNNYIPPYGMLKPCNVSIKLTEVDRLLNVYETYRFSNILFLPGKKPKAFPFLTNGTLRKTYSESLISICAVKNDFTNDRLSELSGTFIDNQDITDKNTVVNMMFARKISNTVYGEFEVLQKGKISLHPIPDKKNVINVIFQNQNRCPDWFSFSSEWERHSEVTHLLSKKFTDGADFKAKSTVGKTIKINTGWLFEEELELLDELIASPVCYAKINAEWLKLIPISKKPLHYDSLRNINSQIVEFKMAE